MSAKTTRTSILRDSYAALVTGGKIAHSTTVINSILEHLGDINYDVYVFVRAFALIVFTDEKGDWREELKRAKIEKITEFKEVPIFVPPEGQDLNSHFDALFTYCSLIESIRKENTLK